MALFNPQQLKATVLIEEIRDSKPIPIATGFFVGFSQTDNRDPSKKSYNIFLVTNRHVFEGKNQLSVRVDKANRLGVEHFNIALKKDNQTLWLAHQNANVDLAMLNVSAKVLNSNGVEWIFFNEEVFALHKDFDKLGIALGDGVFIVGFPMGISGSLQNHAIVRSGTIARADSEIVSRHKYFLIDATIYPGNSGGPVILKPTNDTLQDTYTANQTYLIGVVSGYQLYQELLYSHQSSPPTVAGITVENSGLALVVPMDFVREIYNDYIEKNKIILKEEHGTEKTFENVAQTSVAKR